MKKLTIEPQGWPCRLCECPPGYFVFDDDLCFKSEYGDSYCDSGESFWGGTTSKTDRDRLIVQPAVAVWEKGEVENE